MSDTVTVVQKSNNGCLTLALNLIWLFTGGWSTALGWLIAGGILCITIVGIPLGLQAFKMAALTLMPFGKTIVYGGGAPSLIANCVWILLAGLWMALAYLVAGALYCITVVGIPWGLQLFKMAKLSLAPFGSQVM